MAGLKGQWDYTVDSKGRFALPAKLRRSIRPEANDVLTITRGFEPCLYAYPSYEWENVERLLSELNMYQRDSRSLVRTFLGWADDATIDGQGRIALSKRHLDFAGITDRVTIVGTLNRIEIWSPEHLQKEIAGQTFAFDDLAEFMLGGSQPPTTDTESET